MAYKYYNNNPLGISVGDCVIRAISTILNTSWEETYIELAAQGILMSDLPSSNSVWGSYLKNKGFKRSAISNLCPDCYTIKDFVNEHTKGKYLLATGTHVVAVIDGEYYDTWDSGDEIPVYYWYKEE